MHKIVCGIVFSLLAVSLLSAEMRTFTNDFGDTVDAELLEYQPDRGIVSMRLKSGNKIEAMITAFSQDDQKYIQEWWERVVADKQVLTKEARLTISAKMNRKSKSNAYDKLYYVDDETKSYFPEIVIENHELQQFSDNEVRIVILAEDFSSSDQMLVVSASTQKVDLRDREKNIMEGEPFRLRIYQWEGFGSSDYKYGYEYEGYIVIVKNSKGEITHQRSSKSKYLNNMKLIYSCKAGEIYDDAFQHKLNVSPNSYFVR